LTTIAFIQCCRTLWIVPDAFSRSNWSGPWSQSGAICADNRITCPTRPAVIFPIPSGRRSNLSDRLGSPLILGACDQTPQPFPHIALQRFHRWAMLWLKWFAAFSRGREPPRAALAANAGARALLARHHRAARRQHRDPRAAPLVRGLDPPRHAQHRHKRAQKRRAIVGGAIRRALRSKDLHQRIAALSQDIDTLVALFLKRAPHGLTRRRPILARPESRGSLYRAPAVYAWRIADTS